MLSTGMVEEVNAKDQIVKVVEGKVEKHE